MFYFYSSYPLHPLYPCSSSSPARSESRLMPDTPPDPSSPPKPRRLRGAPLNNLNALKHGFYARKFRSTDLVDLAESEFKGLKEEMTMLRVYMRGVIEKSSGVNSLAESIEVLRVLALAATSLTRMAKTQEFLTQGDPDVTEFSRILSETYEKLRIEGVQE